MPPSAHRDRKCIRTDTTMRLLRFFKWSSFLLLLLFNSASAESIYGPSLGFTRDTSGTAIWPIIGIPGAALLAKRLEFGGNIRDAVISPKQDYALAVRSDDGSVVVATLRTDPPTLITVLGTYSNPSLLAISPSGTSAAVYDGATGSFQVVRHLPESAEVIQETDLSGMPGRASAVALSD